VLMQMKSLTACVKKVFFGMKRLCKDGWRTKQAKVASVVLLLIVFC
jgi:hypothetical protein